MPIDVDACALSNASAWIAKADAVVAAHPAANAFRIACDSSRLGTNVTMDKLVHFATTGRLAPTFDVVASATDGADAQAKVYGSAKWGVPREAIEVELQAFPTALYATLDLPATPGDATYGPVRLVYQPGAAERAPIVLPHNSASGYAQSGTVDTAALCSDAARWEERGAVATAERGARAVSVPTSDWPTLVAGEDPTSTVEKDLIEVILRDGERPLDAVDTLRMTVSDYDSINDAYLRSSTLAAASLTPQEVAFSKIGSAETAGTLTVEVL